MKRSSCVALSICGALALSSCASWQPIPYNVDAHLRSTPDTVVLGHLPAGRKPVLTVRSGQVVRIDTISHQGLTSGMDPVKFFGARALHRTRC